jgi:hypothetical protein
MTLNLFWVCRAIDTGFWMVGPPFSDIILLEANMSADTNQSSQNLLGTFARLYWMLFGNLVLLFTGFAIARSDNAVYPSILCFLFSPVACHIYRGGYFFKVHPVKCRLSQHNDQ